ncbi:DNA-directed RNA polymerase subunit P [Candidatus Nanohalococcus occultus]|uniref:DNA-directed RNA polymerase subunit Rpo12 n=1 Tax=Candidatus Nanohalococcus occultus TaxID=2978047 RepID=A0ABY8CFH5_9ARCH|nr:DNA-directed RNA polymerase subunit P [Candidatus Nanohaloarchaeota archaeon SVXNc]
MSEEETTEEVEELEEQEPAAGYKCVKCEQEVTINPVEEKIICPKCSHRVLFKLRSRDTQRVKAL